jgi:hypothetical protein
MSQQKVASVGRLQVFELRTRWAHGAKNLQPATFNL